MSEDLTIEFDSTADAAEIKSKMAVREAPKDDGDESEMSDEGAGSDYSEFDSTEPNESKARSKKSAESKEKPHAIQPNAYNYQKK